ncbi:hypothetical protein ACFQ4N_01765 [Oceanobacillus iheyensis]|uniref:DUF3887 domain-containing protein n=1 Tax=Oceanobacillus iheyensis (strain DSM 14371 / CIP 107618 / JCM 11309 / KCTC 3954 / HTE831) TaxID=221109 RepID=Q8EN34_OCEIH|nr:hypothetical protein [Oceanobacillus iheyensis]BAC14612.1 hypothetical protein [Oceanobacillus iheyensis HTE831]
MKKILLVVLCMPFILAGCLSPTSVKVVSDAYEAAIVEDDELVARYFSEEYLLQHPAEELTQEMAEDVRNRYGINMMNLKELRNRELQDSYIEEVEKQYGNDDWHIVVAQTNDQEVVVWTIIRGEASYILVNSDRMSFDRYNEEIIN